MAGSDRKKNLGYWWLRLLSPLTWPIAIRRVILITLPISVLLYVAAVIIMFAVMLLVAISVPIIAFWSTPQQRLRAGYGYGAEKKRRRRRRVGYVDQDEPSLD